MFSAKEGNGFKGELVLFMIPYLEVNQGQILGGQCQEVLDSDN